MAKDGTSSKTATPRLRFPEFRKAEGWEPTTIGELGSFYYGKSAPKWSLAVDAPTPCVRYGELYTKFGPVITETYSRTNSPPETLRFSKGGEILVPRVGEKAADFGKHCCYLPLKNIAIGEMISVFVTKQHPLFYTYYFRSLHREFASVVEGQNVKNLYYGELEPLTIHRPPLAEQRKIAACLTSVDEWIGAQGRQVAALAAHKRGLMQQLFPREFESRPRLRFTEFREDWQPTSLGDLVEIQSGGTPSKANPEFWNGSIPWVSAKDMKQLFLDDSEDHISQAAVDDGAKLMPIGTLLILTRGMTLLKDVPICVLRREMTFNQDVKALRANDDVDSLFLAFLLLGNKERLLKMVDIAGHGTGKLNTDELRAFELMTPSPAEQQRIAACLSGLDARLSAASEKLAALKTHKKGLMQQLFPTAEGL